MKWFFVIVASMILIQEANAKQAKCYATDEGYYDCQFKPIGGDGSFVITYDDGPAYYITIDSEPNKAYAHVRFGTNRTIPLVGKFTRSTSDSACWENKDLEVKICAW